MRLNRLALLLQLLRLFFILLLLLLLLVLLRLLLLLLLLLLQPESIIRSLISCRLRQKRCRRLCKTHENTARHPLIETSLKSRGGRHLPRKEYEARKGQGTACAREMDATWHHETGKAFGKSHSGTKKGGVVLL